jgi:hypothetical protein
MAETTIELAGEEATYSSKKAMLKDVGRVLLEREDHPMTVRQLYYRFVALDLLENKESQYQYLCESMKEARLEGTVPWDDLEDRTRSAGAGDAERKTPQRRLSEAVDYLRSAPERHERPRWEGQSTYVELWVEKQALEAFFSRIADDLGVKALACRGYPSITVLRDASERIGGALDDQETAFRDAIIVYFGDYDPSGQDIERHIRETLRGTFGVDVEVERAALNRAQIDEHRLPPQPAKRTDARYESFREEHGDMAVELDAMPPEAMRELAESEVAKRFDKEHHEEVVLPRERRETKRLEERVEELLG